MIKLAKTLSMMLAGAAACAVIAAETSEPTPIKVWPRQERVNLPTNLEQFIFVEVPKLPVDGEFTIEMTLPENITVKQFITGKSPAVPPGEISICPYEWQQKDNNVIMKFPDGEFPEKEKGYLSFSADVQTAPGEYQLGFKVTADGKEIQNNSIPVKIYPELINRTSDIMRLGAWYYNGIAPEFIPVFVKQFTAAGVNAFYSMEGEVVNGKVEPQSIADYAKESGCETGVVFFSNWVVDYIKQKGLPEEFKDVEITTQSLIDHPEAFKYALKSYIDYTTAGKPYDVIIYDAETGAIKGDNKLAGDLSQYSLEKFSKQFNIDHTVTPEEILEKYQAEWIKYNCEQSNNIAALTRELIDEQYPDRLLKVYSGYEYDFDPYKDLTRRLYAVDWNSMADTFIDYAGAGYYGSRQDLSHTAEVLSGRTVYIPAEMYVENFLTKNIGDLSPEKWAMRLIEVFMNSGMRGMTYWYANDMDGAALIAVSEFTKFVLLVEDFALRGTFDPDAISVMPKTEADNVYVIRDTKQAMVVALNRSDKSKRIRLTLNDFKIKGYTSDLQITDMVSGEKIPANRNITIEVEPWNYRVLQLLDDGN